jgi:hypothetical protein
VDTRLGGLPGYYDAKADVVYIDRITLAIWDAIIPGTAEWTETHEEGHRATLHSTLDVDAVGKVRLERLAQCWAEGELGHGPPYTDDAEGYWDCPDHLVARLRMPDAT